MEDYDFLDQTVLLNELVEEFMNEQSQENLMPVLNLLYYTEVLVPFNPKNVEELEKGIEVFDIEKHLDLDGEYLLMQGEGDLVVLPVFTDERECADITDYSFITMPFVDTIEIAKKLNTGGLIVNPQSTQFFIHPEGYEVFNTVELDDYELA